jgi:hypothetical protein
MSVLDSVQRVVTHGPYSPAMILDEISDRSEHTSRLFGRADLSIANPSDATTVGKSHPEAAVASDAKCGRGELGKRCVAESLPGRETHAVESKQTSVRPDPEITIPILRDGINRAERHAVTIRPGCQRIAGQQVVQIGGRGGRSRRRQNQQATQQCAHVSGGQDMRNHAMKAPLPPFRYCPLPFTTVVFLHGQAPIEVRSTSLDTP